VNNRNNYVLAAIAAAAIYFAGLQGLILGASILLYVAIIATILPVLMAGQEKVRALEKRLEPAGELDGEEFSFGLPDPSPNGWEHFTIHPSRQRYQRECCFGGPPTHNETWQYEIKDAQVFHRLIDANEVYFDDPVWEVINGKISEDGVARNTSESYVRAQIEKHRREVEWHECTGSVSLEILAVHFRSQPWQARAVFARKHEKLTATFGEIEKQLLTLGAVEKEYGGASYFAAPEGASEELKMQIKSMQRDLPSKSRYSDSSGISYAEFAERKTTLATLSRLLSGLHPPSTRAK